jgi:hypothetical protein
MFLRNCHKGKHQQNPDIQAIHNATEAIRMVSRQNDGTTMKNLELCRKQNGSRGGELNPHPPTHLKFLQSSGTRILCRRLAGGRLLEPDPEHGRRLLLLRASSSPASPSSSSSGQIQLLVRIPRQKNRGSSLAGGVMPVRCRASVPPTAAKDRAQVPAGRQIDGEGRLLAGDSNRQSKSPEQHSGPVRIKTTQKRKSATGQKSREKKTRERSVAGPKSKTEPVKSRCGPVNELRTRIDRWSSCDRRMANRRSQNLTDAKANLQLIEEE